MTERQETNPDWQRFIDWTKTVLPEESDDLFVSCIATEGKFDEAASTRNATRAVKTMSLRAHRAMGEIEHHRYSDGETGREFLLSFAPKGDDLKVSDLSPITQAFIGHMEAHGDESLSAQIAESFSDAIDFLNT